ncbi:uncharacterized protein LOC120631732 [Pararge aegeria]|uniref:uncharacterized protein LOC120631732 n=1 Tax=Pararge aegeria TaxID=116150 RepID=UPI0019CF9121|nr:uncharacterized protein LOC120631732 [Pararge aegeria]
MDGMEDFPADFTKPFIIPFTYLKRCNFVFFNNDIPFWKKQWRFVIVIVVVILNFISMWIYFFQVFGLQTSTSDMAFVACACLIGLQSILKATVLLPKSNDIEHLIEGLAKMWKTKNLSVVQIKEKNRRLEQLNFRQTALYWGTTIGTLQNVFLQLFNTVIGKIRHKDFDFLLPFGYVYPFDPVKNWARYLLVYALQSYSIIHLVHYYLGAECLLVTLCCQLSTEFALLREDIQYLIPMSDRNRMPEEFTVDNNMTIEAMIKNHQELIKLAQALNHIFNRMVFVDLWFFAMILCFFAVVLSSTGIADSAYENPWYEGEIRYQKTIRFIIMRAQLPCYVTSINYVPITLNTFTTVNLEDVIDIPIQNELRCFASLHEDLTSSMYSQKSPSIKDITDEIQETKTNNERILKAVVLLPKKKDIENLIKGLAMIWKTDNLNHLQVKQKNRRLKQLNFGQSVFYWGTTIAIIQNLVPQLILTVLGKIRQPDYKFILPLGYVYPFDPVMNWGRYLLVYVFQTYTLLRLLFFYLGIHCLLITLCSQLSTEFALLREDIKNASPMPNKSKMSEETNVDKSITIEIIVKQHQELIKLAQLLNYIFNRMVFIDFCFYVSHDALDKFTNIVTILALLVMVYLFCYYCEMLKEESAGIAESAYENLWYDGGTHYHKTIGFIIMRAQNPCYVMSLNYAPITLNTFTKVVSTTWSYFSLATTMCGTDKE